MTYKEEGAKMVEAGFTDVEKLIINNRKRDLSHGDKDIVVLSNFGSFVLSRDHDYYFMSYHSKNGDVTIRLV